MIGSSRGVAAIDVAAAGSEGGRGVRCHGGTYREGCAAAQTTPLYFTAQ